MFGKMCDHSNGWRPEDGVPDLAMMSDITTEGINVNLRTRYQLDQIYTFSGSILIAVNPYKQLDIYNNEWIVRYRRRNFDQTDPHIFALTEAMYTNLIMPGLSWSHSSASSSSSSSSSASECESSPSDKKRAASTIGIKNQACVISGESGAGKTETAKFILSYLCAVTPNKSVWMEQQILEANTILEAFGNAKTVRNDNSSRFGRFIQICFDSRHQIKGCIIQDYLLEQSRITYQSVGERNYHVFYQLLAAGQTNEEFRQKFHLMPANFYDYLNKTQCYTIDSCEDCAMFDSLRTAMSVLNMGQEICDSLFRILSAVLWLGNLQFRCSDDADGAEQCRFTESDEKILQVLAELLGIDRAKLEPIMLKRQINVRGSITEIPFKLHEARDNRNGMAKVLYSRLFTWVVNFINASTNPGMEYTCFIGVLDIFGFENFETNSFEQLCINYANEKLHKYFNQHMFAMEQELYRREGVEFCDINYTDNTLCLELLERPPNCILRLLSEECRMPKGSDDTLLEKLHSEFSTINPNPFYLKGHDRRNWSSEFSVRHFAGSVTYSIAGFIKKNKDAQQSQLLDMIETSTNPLLFDIVHCQSTRDKINLSSFDNGSVISSRLDSMMARKTSIDAQLEPLMSISNTHDSTAKKARIQSQKSFSVSSTKPPTSFRRESSFTLEHNRHQASYSQGSQKSRPTVADAFRHQLASLVELLNSVNPWYVRCIKPNLEKSATDYDDRQVLMQLRYLGMSDLIRIRREGYPIHLTKHQFVCRYRCLMLKFLRLNPSKSPINLDEKSLHDCCVRMLDHFQLDPKHWKIGKSMVLLRSIVYQPMEQKRNKLFVDVATRIQSCWRGTLERRKYLRQREAAIRIQGSFRNYRQRLLYLRQKRAVLTIQAYCRGMFAREIANAMREIKRVQLEKIRKAQELRRIEEQQRGLEQLQLQNDQANALHELNNDANGNELNSHDCRSSIPDENSSSNISPMVSSSTSWVAQEVNEARQKLINARDRKEMEELVKVLEHHGISIDALQQGDEGAYADFERLYDVLGNQMPTASCDTQSISTSVNEDDHCSYATTGTNGDGDSISCSGQSHISSTVTDDPGSANDHMSNKDPVSEAKNDTVNNLNQNAIMQNDDVKYHSNSVESIASIVSSASMNLGQQPVTPQRLAQDTSSTTVIDESACESAGNHHVPRHTSEAQNVARTSTFTGTPLVVGGSKLVSNGRPLTRIEEEPNSIISSPSKTPCKMANSTKSAGLFPPKDHSDELPKDDLDPDVKRRRIERRMQQVQQESLPVPTTAGVPTASPSQMIVAEKENYRQVDRSHDRISPDESADIDAIYCTQKNNILAYAERHFNSHPRDNSSGTGTMMRTLTRRRRSVDNNLGEYLTKAEMLSYNSTFTIATSHIKMHDPHNVQISCSIFKNLCKYMTGDSAKNDNEVRIIQSIIRHGIEKSELRDEIYIQIIRQLTNNSNREHCLRLWILLGLVSASFSPSKNFSKYLFEYLRSKPRKDPSIACHAQFCLDNLLATRIGTRKLPPSILEIQACKNLSNLTCKIHLLDGRCEQLGVHPCDTAIDTLTKLAHKINLQSIEGWALYESYTSGTSKYPHPSYEQKGDFERTVKSSSFMADLIATWQDGIPKISNISLKVAQRRLNEGNFKLTLKKKIFRGPKIRNDPVEIGLLYAQAVHNVVRKDCFFVDENLTISLAGLQAQVMLGNASDAVSRPVDAGHGQSRKSSIGKSNKSIKTPVQLYDVDNYICLRLRNQVSRSKKEWCNLIYQAHKQYHNVNEVFCKMRYLSMVIYHCPLYGTATFNVIYKGYQALDQNLMLGINAEGLVLIRSSDKALINAYRYGDVCSDRGVTVYLEENLIQFNVRDRSDCNDKTLTFDTEENEEIASLIVSYSPTLKVHIRGPPELTSFALDANIDLNVLKKKTKLKMTLEDRMRTHQEVQNSRRSIIKSGKLRRVQLEQASNPGLLRHTLRKLSTSKVKSDKPSRFENIYGTTARSCKSDLPQTASDYNIHGSNNHGAASSHETEADLQTTEISGATAPTTEDEHTKAYPHKYWAYTKFPLKNSLLTIYDTDLEEASLLNFNRILTYSGLLSPSGSNGGGCGGESSGDSNLDSSSTDSGIASQQSLSHTNGGGKPANDSPSSTSSGDLYDVCPKKLDERDSIKLAQGILDRCLKRDADILKNEFFLQLIKQTTDHPDLNSDINKRHWQLLALACSVTYPSDPKILSYLYAHLRRCSLDQISNEGIYAQFTLRSLQGTLDTKGRKYAPSEMEILSTINCRRIYARVYFLDGQFQAVEFDPCATIAEVVDQIKQKIGLKPDTIGYALFQPLDDDCEQVLDSDEKVGDAISAWETWQRQRQSRELRQQSQSFASLNNNSNNNIINRRTNAVNKESIASLNSNPKMRTHKFVFKKYLFPNGSSDFNDPVERELLYYQTVASIKEDKFPILEQEATILCALKAQIEIGDFTKLTKLPREHVRMIYKQIVMSIMPPHTYNNLQVQTIAEQHQAFKSLNRIETKKYFFNLIQSFGRASLPDSSGCILLHQAHVYCAKQTFATAWPSDIWIVINYTGLHMLVTSSRRVLASCEYRQISDYNSNNDNLMLIMLTNNQSRYKYTFQTKHAQHIASQMKDYIVINTNCGSKRRKSVGFNLK